jgi:hypothetical protein
MEEGKGEMEDPVVEREAKTVDEKTGGRRAENARLVSSQDGTKRL